MKRMLPAMLAAAAVGCAVAPSPADVLGDPSAPLAGRVLGQPVRTRDVEELRYYIQKSLADRHARDQGIVATEAEKEAYSKRVREFVARATGEPPERSAEADAARDLVAGAFILQWKVNASLYRQYGGRIAWQQGGAEPVDAWRRFLEGSNGRGGFTILEPAMEAAFWRYWREEGRHSFYAPGSAEEARAFASPPWLAD